MGRVLVNCVSPGSVAEETFARVVREVRASNVDRSLAIVLGAAQINGVQRKAAVELMKEKRLQTVVLTDSAVTRGILTAISWLGAAVSAKTLADIDGALDELMLQAADRSAVRDTALRLRAELEQSLRSRSASASR